MLEDDPNLGSNFVATGGAVDRGAGGAGRRLQQERGAGGGQRHKLRAGNRRLLQAEPKGPVADARKLLQDLFERMERQNDTCHLRLMLFAERLYDRPLAAIMPTNVMRNAAMLGATTPLSAMFDVDLGFSASINRLVRNSTWIEFVARETNATQPALCTPPAWEISTHLPADDMHSEVVNSALTGWNGWTRQQLARPTGTTEQAHTRVERMDKAAASPADRHDRAGAYQGGMDGHGGS
ncbi:hypothetical protein PLESTB_001654200 [Pleodorina starrii]|uniref:Uncharacterized protein n=1 Tax=Pleodorina starrii TaxID=330485 RepID=A0A9W6F8S8_9CHLO|nr:hypothetical protein PLESTB_001654200 [Pleodorina starrii]